MHVMAQSTTLKTFLDTATYDAPFRVCLTYNHSLQEHLLVSCHFMFAGFSQQRKYFFVSFVSAHTYVF